MRIKGQSADKGTGHLSRYSHPGILGQYHTLEEVNRLGDERTPVATTRYRYEFAQEQDKIPPLPTDPADRKYAYQTNLTAIIDGEGQAHEFTYDWDRARKVFVPTEGHFDQVGVPRNVTKSRRPGGLGTARFVNESSMRFTTVTNPQFVGYRRTRITDAMGGVHTYNFTGSQVVRLNVVKELYKDTRNIPDWLVPHLVVFTQLDVTRAGLGSESYHFNLEAGLRPDVVRDHGLGSF